MFSERFDVVIDGTLLLLNQQSNGETGLKKQATLLNLPRDDKSSVNEGTLEHVRQSYQSLTQSILEASHELKNICC